MAYNTRQIIYDVTRKNPVPAYFNPDTDDYEPLYGQNGANRVLLWGANDQPLLTVENPGKVEVTNTVNTQLTGSNVEDEQRIPTKPVYLQTTIIPFPTETSILAGSNLRFDATAALKGAKEISIVIVELSQTYTVNILSRPINGVTYVVDEVAKDQPVIGLYNSRRHAYTAPGPLLGHDIVVEINNTSTSDAILKGLYVIGR